MNRRHDFDRTFFDKIDTEEKAYSSATIYGERKKAKFEKILCALSEKSLSEMGLIAGTPEMAISSEAGKTGTFNDYS